MVGSEATSSGPAVTSAEVATGEGWASSRGSSMASPVSGGSDWPCRAENVIYLGTDEPTDIRHSMVRAMSAYEAARAEINRGNIGEVVLVLRDLSDEERDLVEYMLLRDDDPGAIR
jgi:hypothetical protein